jgi:K+ transporter
MEERIRGYLQVLNPNLLNLDDDVINFTIAEVKDRVLLYLNREDIPQNIERVLARVINNGLMKVEKDRELAQNNEVNRAISSISDNGQSVSYSNEVTNYFANAKDNELFTGFESLLSRYRRVTVVYPK